MVGQLVRHCFLEFVLLIEIDCHVLHLVQHEVSVRLVTGRFRVLGSVVLEGDDGGVVLLRDVHVVFGSSLISEKERQQQEGQSSENAVACPGQQYPTSQRAHLGVKDTS